MTLNAPRGPRSRVDRVDTIVEDYRILSLSLGGDAGSRWDWSGSSGSSWQQGFGSLLGRQTSTLRILRSSIQFLERLERNEPSS